MSGTIKSVRKALLAAALLLCPCLATAQVQAIDPRFAEAMAICLDNYPDFSGARHAALTAGFQSDGRFQGLDIYTAYRRDLLAAFTKSPDPACVFGLDGLRDEAAVATAQAALVRRFGTEVVRLRPSPDGEYIESWVAVGSTGGILPGVHGQTTFQGYWPGSLISVQPYKAPPQ